MTADPGGGRPFPLALRGSPPHLGGCVTLPRRSRRKRSRRPASTGAASIVSTASSAPETLVASILALEAHDVPAFVRVPSWDDGASIGQALDARACGVIVPMVESVEQARFALPHARILRAGPGAGVQRGEGSATRACPVRAEKSTSAAWS
jgi:hypothetical protein